MPDAPGLVPLDAILEARARIVSRVHRTPMLTSETGARIAAAAGIAVGDGRLYLKAEHLQKTGSFKPRGTTNRVLTLSDAERAAGIVTVSAGNAAQAYAWAAREAGVHAVVVMPAAAVRSKVDAARGYGAEVILHGADVGETFAEMERQRVQRGLVLCHPFDDPAVIAGHGSVGLEILEDVPDVDVVVVGVGGGGLISGIATAIKERRPSARVYGVEPELSNAVSLGVAAGEVVRITPRSVADGLNAPFVGAWTLAACRRYVDGFVLVDDPTILAGLRFGVERLKQILEPAGAAALAAILFGKVPVRAGERVVVILSGGNVEVARLGELIAGAAPLPGTVGADPASVPADVPAIAARADASADEAPAAAGPLSPDPVVMAGPEVLQSAAAFELPSARALVAAGFDLLRTAQPELRRASLYIGLLTLLVVGPAAVFAIYLLTRSPELLGTLFGGGVIPETGELATVVVIIALLIVLILPAVIAISIDAANIGIALLAARHRGRPLHLEEAVRRSRQSFWRIVMASALLGIVPLIALTVAESWIVRTLGNGPDASAVVSAVVGVLLGTPFAYLATGIVIGDVGPIDTFRRSVRLVRARPRLALVIALFATAVSVAQTFAIGAGGDVLTRVAEVLHVDFESGPLLTLISVILVLAGVVAIGSLTFTISAIASAPQVVAFLGLTHFDSGIDLARGPARSAAFEGEPSTAQAAAAPPPTQWSQPQSPRPGRLRLVTWPMFGLVILATLTALAGIAAVSAL